MSELKKKEDYESPSTKKAQVVLEEGFMAGSITDDKGKNSEVKATQQEYKEYDMTGNTEWE